MKIYNDYHDSADDYWQKVSKYSALILAVIEKSKVSMSERSIKVKLGSRLNETLFGDALAHLSDRVTKSFTFPHQYSVIAASRPASVMRRDRFNYSTSGSIRPASVEARRGSF